MPVRLIDGSLFLHVPKTGGTWVTSILEHNGLVHNSRGHKHADYDRCLFPNRPSVGQLFTSTVRQPKKAVLKLVEPRVPACDAPVFRFTFVRHPLAWYESFWKYMQGRGWHDWGTTNSAEDWHPNAVLNGLGSDDFNEFVRNVVDVRPGYVSELYFSYTKPGINFIGRTESLKEDLSLVLDRLGLDYDRDALRASKKENVSKTASSAVQWDPELRKLVMQLELPALVHFGYLSDDERSELGISRHVASNAALRKCA